MQSSYINHTTANAIKELLHSTGFTEHKSQLVHGFTRGRTTDHNQMFEWEAAGLLKWLQSLLVETPT